MMPMLSMVNRLFHFLRQPRCKTGIAALMLGLFLSLHALAASDFLHQELCSDAHAADHHCAVSVFAQGQIEAPAHFNHVVEPPAAILEPLLPSLPPAACPDHLEPPGRAPPAVIL